MLIVAASMSSCNLTKYVPDDEFLLNKNTFEILKDSSSSSLNKIDIDDLNSILKQQPNRKIILGYRFHLNLYNISNQKRIDKAIERKKEDSIFRNQKILDKNRRKLAKKTNYKQKLYVDRKLTFGERLRSTGEEPVILDRELVEKSSRQLSVFLINKGYFDNVVTDTLVVNQRKKMIDVIYKIHAGKPYVYRNINLKLNDSLLRAYLDSIQDGTLLRQGDAFDTDLLDSERKRITEFLLNNGYHYFNKEFIYFKADTSIGENKIDLVMGIQNYKFKDEFTDNIIEKRHQQYKIDAINFELYPDFDKDRFGDSSSIFYRDVSFSYYQKLICKPELLYNALAFKVGDLYSKSDNNLTYKKLSGIGLFNAVSIQYDTTQTNGLSVYIKLKQAKNQTFTLSADGTNNEGLFGVEGSVNYAHRNIFKGAEKLSISMSGGVETQLLVTGSEEGVSNDINSELFNTVEFGPKISLILPKYLLLNNLKILRNHSNAKTEFTASLNYQKRPDFTRAIQEVSYGWIVREKGPITWYLNPLLISAVDITKEPEFEQQIIDLNDQFIAASFQDHIIAGGLFSFEYNGQNDRRAVNFFYIKTTFESGGGLLYRLHQAMNKPYDDTASNSYDLLGIRYAHFQKLSLDLSYYVPIGKRGKLVYRLAGGVGFPRENFSEALPFEKSFFSGGANGMRAWRARSLGPGSFLDDDNSYDKIGDLQIEANFEARFPLISWIEGAFFVDAGNIWLLNDDPLRPGGKFKKDLFLSEIAIGSGLGLRMDFDFFIVRMDLAIPIKNPSVPINDFNRVNGRWIFDGNFSDRKEFHQLQFNLGIGYPF